MRTSHSTLAAAGIAAALALLPAAARAALPPIQYTLTPIVGFERAVKRVPDYHVRTRLTYGALLTAGYRELALEAEYTRASDREEFPLQGLSLRDTDDRLKLGLRTTHFLVFPRLSFTLRAGGQASRNTHEEVLNGVATRTVGKIQYDPYAGAGVDLRLLQRLTLGAGLTAVFREFPDMSKTDYQLTFGLTLGIL